MKTDSRYNLSWGVRLRMLVRFVGITAVLVAAAGAIYLSSILADWKPETLGQAVRNEIGTPAFVGAALLFGGALLAIFALVVEVLSGLLGGASRRGATGISAALQIVLATGLFVAVNVYSFLHHTIFDTTINKQFTLPEKVVGELQKLKSETTIVVLQQHKTFGRLSVKPDRYDYAAERKVVEKVLDLVDQFRKVGPQFRVVVLDIEEEGFDKKLAELTKDNPKLREAIHAAPENSIFFASEGKLQRMSFNEFYQLDKHASKAANSENGNLVLYPQGIESLVKRITAIEEKRPKIAVAVTHPLLSTQQKKGSGAEEYTLAGLKKSLNDYGFDVVDVVLKKNYRGELDGDPASYTLQETKLIELEGKAESSKDDVRREKKIVDRLVANRKKLDAVKSKPPAERIDAYRDIIEDMTRRRIAISSEDRSDPDRQKQLEDFVVRNFESWEKEHGQDLADAEEELQKVQKELGEIQTQERAIEDRYLTDVKAKFSRLLSDCDMLIVPRMTIVNLAKGFVLPRDLHKIDKSQAEVIKEFMKSGKPVLVCSGPVNIPSDAPLPVSFDDLETLLNERGVELARQTVLFNVETKSFRETTSEEEELADTTVDVPPLRLLPPEDWNFGKLKPNPISQSLEVLVNSIDQPLDISLRAPRPVSLSEEQQKKQDFVGEFLWTNSRSWNERYPFNFMIKMQMNPFTMQPTRTRVRMPAPRYDAPADDAGKKAKGPKGDEERRGPFSIAVAVDSAVPSSWYGDKEKAPAELPKSRIVVIGQGSIFNKPDLSPATEKLLLVTCNWLLNRDERMPRAADPQSPYFIDRPWQYPRVEMNEGTKNLWHWGTFLGLPALFVYLGLIVLMLRRVR